jgi:hypothetical protein
MEQEVDFNVMESMMVGKSLKERRNVHEKKFTFPLFNVVASYGTKSLLACLKLNRKFHISTRPPHRADDLWFSQNRLSATSEEKYITCPTYNERPNLVTTLH